MDDDYVRGLSLLFGNLAALVFWSRLFNLSRTRAMFVRAHRAAWRSGWYLDRLRVGRESTRFSYAIGRAALFFLNLAVNRPAAE